MRADGGIDWCSLIVGEILLNNLHKSKPQEIR